MVKISVTVDDAGRAKLDEVAANLQRAGMTVENKLSVLGVISGHADEGAIENLRKVPGVLQVSNARIMRATTGT